MSVPGRVTLVGAGPGDPELLTVRGARRLASADLVLYDALSSEGMRDLAPHARWFYVGKRACRNSIDQDVLNRLMIKHASRGRHVVRLKCGDPFVFGRGGEEVLALVEAGIPFRVVAGITSGLAALTAASIPTTRRGINQAIILATGHGADGEGGPDWRALARTGQPLVLYMAMNNLGAIAAALIDGGLAADTPVAAVASATMAGERILVSRLDRLAADVAADGLAAPAIVVIGTIVAARDELMAALATLADGVA